MREHRTSRTHAAVKHVLILGGTTEAAELARRVLAEFGGHLDVTTSLAGRLPDWPDLPGEVRRGGFGGGAGLAAYLVSACVDLLIDATHPFATIISRSAAQACAALQIPRLMLVRPPWRPEPGDRWLSVQTIDEAAALLPHITRRVFLTTGPGALDAFARVPELWFLVRMFAPAAAPLPLRCYEAIVSRPPFTRKAERALMDRYRIDTLVTKNSGGPTGSKLKAARDIGVPVVMIERPPSADSADAAASVDAALTWLRAKIG